MIHHRHYLPWSLLIGTTTLALSLMACSASDKEVIKIKEEEVLAIHDEVMPRLGDIMKLRKQLTQRIDSLDKATSTINEATASVRTDEEKAQAVLLSRQLKEADSLMMDWMTQYKSDTLKQLQPEQAQHYLEQEKDKINNVRSKINSSIEQASQYLKQ